MAADGSIVFDVQIDDRKAQQELNRLNRHIQKMSEEIYVKQQQQMPLINQSKQLAAELDAAKAKLYHMQSGNEFFPTYSIDAQTQKVEKLEKEWNKVEDEVEKYEEQIKKATYSIDWSKAQIGDIQKRLAVESSSDAAGAALGNINTTKLQEDAKKGTKALENLDKELQQKPKDSKNASDAMDNVGNAMDRSRKKAGQLADRLKSIIASALVFNVISAGLRSFTGWMGNVIKTNNEARAAMARLKGALLTLAQPLIEFVLPAFTKFVDILSRIIYMAAHFIAVLFGTTAEKAADSAENLYDEMEAIESTGEAAEEASKSLAAFDEINKISDSAKTVTKQDTAVGIQPDFSGLEEGNSWISNMMNQVAGWVPVALLLGGIALIAIGAAMGSLLLVTAGLGILGSGILSAVENEQLQSWAETLGLNNVQEFVALAVLLGGIAITAIGAAMGNILMVVSGLALIGTTVAYVAQSGMMQDWAETLGLSRAAQYVTAALLIGGMALVVIGAATRNYLMIVAGLGLLSAGVYVGSQSGALQSWWDALQLSGAAGWVTACLLIAGMAFVVFGIALRNIAMVITGVGLFAAGVAVGAGSGTFESWWEVLQLPQAQTWVTPALLIGGIALTVIGIVTANIAMFIGGLAMIFAGINYGEQSGTFDNWWDVLGLEHADSYVTAALLIGGMALVAFGIVTANVLMVIGGLALLGVAAVYGSSTGTFESWSDALHLDDVAGKVTAAIMLAGIALIGIGATMLNPVLILAGLALLGVGAIGNYLTGDSGAGSTRSRILADPNFQTYEVPALARGAVIPPNREFLAVLGDQKSGTNIETPLSTMVEAFNRALDARGGTGGGQQTVILEVDKKVLGRVTYQVNKEESRRIGVDLVGV